MSLQKISAQQASYPTYPDWKSRMPLGIRAYKKYAWILPIFCGSTRIIWGIKSAMNALVSIGVVAANPTDIVPSHPQTMAGYQEKHEYWGWTTPYPDIASEQAKYLRDKAELQSAIDACENNSNECHPHIRAFVEMLKEAKKIPDRITQVEAVNGWINLYVDYDEKEAIKSKSDMDHRSPKQVLIDRMGICDSVARLKLFALEFLGYKPDDIRWVEEAHYENGTQQKAGHAVTLVRIGENNWVMNNQTPRFSQENIDIPQARGLLDDASAIEEDAAQLNVSVQSHWAHKGTSYIPVSSFNSSQRAEYKIKLADELATTPRARATTLTEGELSSINELTLSQKELAQMLSLVMPALKTHYHVESAQLEPANPHRSRKAPLSSGHRRLHDSATMP